MADNFRGLTTGATLGRELPFSQEAEEAVLGGVLRDPSVLPKVIEILKPESFYTEPVERKTPAGNRYHHA